MGSTLIKTHKQKRPTVESAKTNLVAEGVAHHERGVAHGAAQVNQTALGKQDHVVAAAHQVTVHLRLDVDDVLGGGLDVGNIDLKIEVS